MATAQKSKASMKNVLQRHERDRSSLIPLLQDVQKELGFLSTDSIMEVSKYLGIPEADIFGVATFYAQFRFTPAGKNICTICRGTACHVRGSAQLLKELEGDLSIKAGETTDDLQFTIDTVACLGSCALAPVMVINGKVYGRATKSTMKKLVKDIRSSKGNGAPKKKAKKPKANAGSKGAKSKAGKARK